MNNLGRIEIFLEVAQAQSFAKAARKLGISGPAASKQVVALEDELGVKLLNRTTRHVSLTDEGIIYFDRARLAVDELNAAAAQVQDLRETPKGVLRINAPLSFGHMHLLPVISGFAKKYPEIFLQVVLEDRKVDVLADGYDIVIRIGSLDDSSLVAKPLAACPIVPVASPSYLRKYGRPRTVADLEQHKMISYAMKGGVAEWPYRDPHGKAGILRAEGTFQANTAEMLVQAALDGLGVAFLPIFSVSAYIKAQQLVQVLPGYETYPPRSVFAVMPPNRYRATKVRLFVDWLVQSCKAMPWQTTP